MPLKSLVVDWETLNSNFDNDKFAISLVVDAFLTSVDESLEKVRTAVDSGDLKAIAMSAHSIKGAILNFGASEAVSYAQDLELQGYEGLRDNYREVFSKLQAAVAVIVAELHAEASRYQEAG